MLSWKHIKLPALAAAVLSLAAASPCAAGTIAGPSSVRGNNPTYQGRGRIEMHNQSGLSNSYTPGVTDYRDFVSETTHASGADITAVGYQAYFRSTVNFDYTFDSLYDITSMALWNGGEATVNSSSFSGVTDGTTSLIAGVDRFDIYTSEDGSYNDATLIASYDNVELGRWGDPAYADVFDFNTTTQYIRFSGSTGNVNRNVSIREIIFEGSVAVSAVPEPNTFALFGVAVAGLAFVRRKKA